MVNFGCLNCKKGDNADSVSIVKTVDIPNLLVDLDRVYSE